jgi:asparagine synthase (glutamine-hydrolysing)
MKCNVLITDEYQWKKISRNKVDIFFKGDLDSACIEILFSFPMKDDTFIQQYINTININFAVVISAENFCIMVVDKIRSIPIVYTNISDVWYVDCRSSTILELTSEIKIDKSSALSVAMSGYTTGDNTIFESIKSLMAGQLVILRSLRSISKIQYYQYLPKVFNCNNVKQLEHELEQVTLNILKKTIDSLNGRQAIIPLSAGNDSRLIASGFKYLGYENVKCYSYGFKDFESDTSKNIADKLGYKWKFIKLNIKKEKKFYKSKEFEEYLKFSDVSTSIPVVRWLSTVRILKESGWINKDAVFINGNTGDFISGGHISPKIYREENRGVSNDKISIDCMLDSFIEKHYNLWGRLYNTKNKSIIKPLLFREYEKLLKENSEISIEAAYESLEYFHRQSKYVISAQRVYEYYGYEWRLPLWDIGYLEFWSKVPVNLKYKQKLYKDMLFHANWSGVWSIPINKSNVRPKWIIPLRKITQIVFLILGNNKAYWHRFEVSVFRYWMDNGRVTTMFPYSEFLFNNDIRGVQSLISKKYLENNKITSIFFKL